MGFSPNLTRFLAGKMGFSIKWDFGPNFSSLKDKMGSHFIQLTNQHFGPQNLPNFFMSSEGSQATLETKETDFLGGKYGLWR